MMHANIGSVTFAGRVLKTKPPKETSSDTSIAIKNYESRKRIRGHLPQPAMLTQDILTNTSSQNSIITFANDRFRDFDNSRPRDRLRSDAQGTRKILSLTTGRLFHRCAIQTSSLTTNLIALDVSASSSIFEYCSTLQTGTREDLIVESKKSRFLRSSLEQLDVSALRHLEILSVRGCANLESIGLPQSLRILDAGGCSNLIRIDYPNGADGSLVALDLGGCRQLRKYEYRIFRPRPGLLGPNTVAAMQKIVNLDLSHVCQQAALDKICCKALRSTISLETFSLRYGANNEVIEALTESQSARRGTLQLVDIAFSLKVTDEAVRLLTKSALKLERLNMRGCKQVTPACYNYIPVYLERRLRGKEDENAIEDDEYFKACSRKGDNLFYFCQKKKK